MQPKRITVHCTDTAPWMAVSVDLIRKWHVEDNGWSDIGYHYLIDHEGIVHDGRPVTRSGAHVGGHNKDNIGIVYFGGRDKDNQPMDTLNEAQLASLKGKIKELQAKYDIPDSEVRGHCDFPGVTKTCPNFDVKSKLGLFSELGC